MSTVVRMGKRRYIVAERTTVVIRIKGIASRDTMNKPALVPACGIVATVMSIAKPTAMVNV